MGTTSQRRGGFSIRVEEDEWANEDRSWVNSLKGFTTCRSITLDASTFSAAHLEAKGAVPSGTALEKLANGKYGPYGGLAGVNEIQVITQSDGTDGGQADIHLPDGTILNDVAWNISAAALQALIEATDAYDIDDVRVARTAGGGGAFVFTLTFGGQYAGQNLAPVTVSAGWTDGGVAEEPVITTTTGGIAGGAFLLFTTTVLGDGSGTDLATAEDVGVAGMWEGIIEVENLPTFDGTDAGEIDADFRAAMIHMRFED